MDAADNETGRHFMFENNRWYRIRLRVTDEKIEAWIDDEQIIDHTMDGREISLRIEVELSKPFGIATYQTTGYLHGRAVLEQSLKSAPCFLLLHHVGERIAISTLTGGIFAAVVFVFIRRQGEAGECQQHRQHKRDNVAQ